MSALTEVESAANEWGTIALSEMVLIKNEHQFNLGYTNTTADYIAKARTQTSGAARESGQTGLYVGLQGTVNLAQPISAGRSAGTNGLAMAKPEASSVPTNAAALLSPQFTALVPLSTEALNSSERNALRQGVNDKITELLFGQFADPRGLGKDQVILFGVVQVTCQPGWRTANSYIADLNVRVEYLRKRKGSSSQGAGKKGALTGSRGSGASGYSSSSSAGDQDDWQIAEANPGVYAVLPLVDSVNFNLADSRRKQLELATSLAAVFAAQGLTGQAQMMTDYVRRQESDLVTRTLLPTITSYSDGGSFGFRIYPLPQAVQDPGTAYGGRGNVLQPVTFPAVVAMVIQKADLEADPEGGKWTHYGVSVRPRWIPTKAPPGPLGRAIRWFNPGYMGGNHRKAFGPARQVALAGELDTAFGTLKDRTEKDSHVLGQARRTLYALDGAVLGAGRVFSLPTMDELGFGKAPEPAPEPAALASLQPLVVVTNLNQSFVLSAKGFTNMTTPTVIIAGQKATVESLANDGKLLVCRAEVVLPPLKGKQTLGVVMASGKQVATANYEVEFMAPKASEPAAKVTGTGELRFKGPTPVTVEVPAQ